jgi:hypothetical protein
MFASNGRPLFSSLESVKDGRQGVVGGWQYGWLEANGSCARLECTLPEAV